MECVGTLSWSGMGLAPQERSSRERPLRLGLEPRTGPRKAGARSADAPWQTAAGILPGGKILAPAARTAHAEAVPVEIDRPQDWTQLVRRCMDGDSGAWAELVRGHHRRVYGLCYRFTGSSADAEDLTQEVFLKVYSNLASFDRGRGSLQVWIATMTRNLLVDHFRRSRNQRATGSLDEGWDQAGELKPVDRLTSSAPSPHQLAASNELAKMVQNALARVTVELREAVILRDLQDMDYKEIAQVLAIPEGTVKSRISRGRAELARLLERNEREVM